MPFVSSDGAYFVRDGRRFFPLGINYLPSYLCGNYLADYRADHINADLDHIVDLGLDCVRVPVFWAGFEPREGEFSQAYLTAFQTFVEACRQRDLLVMPVFLIGTWTGIYSAPYWKAPGMYQGEMLDLEVRHLAAFARRFAQDPAILCWDLSDEPYYLEELPPSPPRTAAGPPAPRADIATQWVARLAAAIHEVDPNHLITLGFDPHPVRADSGFALEEVAQHLDLMSYCIYPWPVGRTEVELIAYGAFQARFFTAGKPPFLHEGPGASSSSLSERALAGRFRAWMYSSLANGNTGLLPWNYTDYEERIHHHWPLDASPQEPDFGICRVDRSLKPRGEELLGFAADVRRLPLDDLALEPPRAAIIYPTSYYQRAGGLHDRLWRHFTLAKGANINTDLVREDRLPSDASLLIAPGFPLRLSTWAALREFVSAGGTLLAIMDDFMFLNPVFADLFGVSVEGLRRGPNAVSFEQPWGGAVPGQSFALAGASADRLWVVPHRARVVASYEDGYPLLLANSFQEGNALLATSPFPLLVDPSDLDGPAVRAALSVFRGARDLAGSTPPVETDLDWVETALFRARSTGDDWAVLVNYDQRPAAGAATVHGSYSSAFGPGDRRLPAERAQDCLRIPLRIEAHGALLWRLSRGAEAGS